MTDDIENLIAEARTPVYTSTSDEVWGRGGVAAVDRDDLIRALADALEAEASKVKQLEARQAHWAADTTAQIKAAEAERDALRGECKRLASQRDAAASQRNKAYRQRDEEREAKSGNIRVLNAVTEERDALRTTIQDAYNAWHMESRERAIEILHEAMSRAIDTKEKP